MNTSVEKCFGKDTASEKMTETVMGQVPGLRKLYLTSAVYESLNSERRETFKMALIYSCNLLRELCVPPWREGYWEMIECIAYCAAIGETPSMEELYMALNKNEKMKEWTYRRYLGNISGFCFAAKRMEMEKLIGVDINANTRLKNREFINAAVFFISSMILDGKS